MRFLSILITLAIIGYAMSIYIDSGNLKSAAPNKAMSKPKEFIDHANQTVDMLNEKLQKQKKKMDDLNSSD